MHPLKKFEYCPVCGDRHFENNSEKSKKCENCGFELFGNPSAAVAAFILNEKNELLVEERAKNPAKGTLDLPGGFADINETAEEAIKREVKEETGLEIESVSYLYSLPNLYHYSDMDINTLDIFFRCRVKDESVLHPGDDAKACKWVSITELRPEQFGLESVSRAIRKFIASRNVFF
ncbi:NUDIX hydrolase [Xylanibacter muris]|uniref:NUDIX domain-containing protein n=1 Tax=Xylanibacter muris TaxID=2736290 RepID=A0ABX2AQP0_9BACT|nr:NUDIX domain-containing protein [Xylanibacter muris]NPD92545.1 NUDIX domain-containing protein [Xylanibacter muris]